MIITNIRLVLSESHRRRVITSLTPVIGWTRVQPGCRACALFTDVDDPRVHVLVEEWDTQDALDCHLRSEQYRRIIAAMELSQEAPEVRFDTVATRRGLEVIEGARLPPGVVN